LYILLGLFTLIFCFGFILIRLLPKRQAYRAISLLVALSFGAFVGMGQSFIIAASLVEISSSPFFSFAFGLFFFYLGGLITMELIKLRSSNLERQWTWDQAASICAIVWIVSAGLLCIALDKKIIMWMPEVLKIFMYMILASALNFCLVFSVLDLYNELYERYYKTSANHPGLAEMLDSQTRKRMFDDKGSKTRVLTIAKSKARYGLLIAASIIAGLYFGLIFGLMRIEEEELYRASLMLRQESLFTFPAGAVVGGMSGLILQLLTMPEQSDTEIDRIIDEAKDDL